MPWWGWFLAGALTGGLVFYIWLAWYLSDMMR